MNIQIISQYYYPDNFRINDISAELTLRGYRVRILTGLPDYSTSHIPKEYKWFRKRRENYCGVEVRRVPTIARRKGVLFRALNYTSFAFSASLYAFFSKKDTDVIFVYGMSPVFQGIPAMIYKRITGKKSVHYCCDLWPESLKTWKVKEKSILFKAVKAISRAIYRDCDIVAISSEPFRKYLIDVCGVQDEKIIYLPQHCEDIYADISGKYEENGCIDFLFAGNLGALQDIPVILRAVSLVKTNRAFCVHIVGDGSEMASLKSLTQELSLEDRVMFHGRKPLEQMAEFYKMADCFLLTLCGDSFTGMTLPSKAQGYLCAGKPVLAAIDGAGRNLIEQADCGEVVSAGNFCALSEKMALMIQYPDKYKEKGLNGRRYYEQCFTTEIFMRGLIEILF